MIKFYKNVRELSENFAIPFMNVKKKIKFSTLHWHLYKNISLFVCCGILHTFLSTAISFKINFLKKASLRNNTTVKHLLFETRSGLTKCWPLSGFQLLVKVHTSRHSVKMSFI